MKLEVGKTYKVKWCPTMYPYNRTAELRSETKSSISFWTDENKYEYFSFAKKHLISIEEV